MTTLYGISQCTTVQRAKNWLDNNKIPYVFVDFKKTPIASTKIFIWLNKLGSQKLINRQSLTWRNLSDTDKQSINNEEKTIALLVKKPTLIKRPILEYQEKLLCGFDLTQYQELFR